MSMVYLKAQFELLNAAGLEFVRLQLQGENGKTNWLNVRTDKLPALADLLASELPEVRATFTHGTGDTSAVWVVGENFDSMFTVANDKPAADALRDLASEAEKTAARYIRTAQRMRAAAAFLESEQ